MISEKIKSIRELIGLSEVQVSNIIYMNSYKYSRSEINDAYLPMEKLILLSIAYKISLDELILEKYSTEDILRKSYLNNLKVFDVEHIEAILKDNLCSCFIPKRKKLNYTTIDLILRNKHKLFGARLKDIRQEKQFELHTIANMSDLSISEYRNFESGFSFPNPVKLVRLSEVLEVSINDLINNEKQG